MASEREIFGFSGPLHLRVVDWNNPHHRRSIAASLVQGVYIIERDRRENRHGQNALAPPWWEFFNFQLNHVLIDPDDQSFFGCIYELRIPDHYYYNHLTQNYPKYVVAFRGTINKPGNRTQDLKLDLQLMLSTLQQSSRFQLGLQCVQDLVWKAGDPARIWVAGHSLGSAIALLVGRHMVRMSIHFETYLFNPPFSSIPFEKIKNEKLKNGARIATSILTAGIAAAVNINSIKPHQDKEFLTLAAWVPYMFVNPSDPICCEYIGHFDHREKMMSMAGGKIGRIAAQNSIASVIANARGNDCDAFHLVPSAYLTINKSPCQEFKQAHGVHQWWRTDVHLEYKLHQYR
ncbi:OLC1v1027819C1 [Oldenlandia corymbosa var. corymbosa]|uniref:OLC1v1027819C1 n=1 Tax=Oldenlandia corymbosa var. corymbosa TaxID=529605 RepID=A0AAV1CAB5_OLDCO|nr:OLC1v1027819C1 [Oldenlandia corymbosa var. corymbosa]